ncbi:hypothetical protein PMIN04_006503 [Paraphaeosphaeria minitans]
MGLLNLSKRRAWTFTVDITILKQDTGRWKVSKKKAKRYKTYKIEVLILKFASSDLGSLDYKVEQVTKDFQSLHYNVTLVDIEIEHSWYDLEKELKRFLHVRPSKDEETLQIVYYAGHGGRISQDAHRSRWLEYTLLQPLRPSSTSPYSSLLHVADTGGSISTDALKRNSSRALLKHILTSEKPPQPILGSNKRNQPPITLARLERIAFLEKKFQDDHDFMKQVYEWHLARQDRLESERRLPQEQRERMYHEFLEKMHVSRQRPRCPGLWYLLMPDWKQRNLCSTKRS